MKLAILLALIVVASAMDLGVNDAPTFTVKALTESSFEHDTQAGTGATTGDWFVMFGVSTCPHCVQAKEAWQEMANQRPTHRTLIAEVDCDASYWVCSRFAIRSYPTFLLFKSGSYYEYRGTRTVDMFQAWLQGPYKESKVGPVPPELAGLNKLIAIGKEVAKDFDQLTKTMPWLAYGSVGMVVVLSVLLSILCVCCPSSAAKKNPAAGTAPAARPKPNTNQPKSAVPPPPAMKATETKKKQ